MLTMNARKRLYQVVIGLLLCELPTMGFAKGARRTALPAEEQGSESTKQQSVALMLVPSTQETTPCPPRHSRILAPSNERTVAPLPYEDTRPPGPALQWPGRTAW